MEATAPQAVDRSTGRLVYLDHLKVLLIALIIAIHAVLGYVGSARYWTYADVQETTLHPVTELVLAVLVVPFGLFMIALLFLVAGLLTPRSLERKGARRFVVDRLLRLGVPFALFTFLVWPAVTYALYHPFGAAPASFAEEYLSDEGYFDTGVLWFIGVLLIFSVGYAGLMVLPRPAGWSRGSALAWSARPIRVGHLAGLALATAAATFLIRLAFPYASESVTDLNLWEWPGCLALFGLGIAASHRDWLAAVPNRLRRVSFAVTLVAGAAGGALLYGAFATGLADRMWGGWDWPALLFAVVESTLMVFGSVWLLGAAQRRLARPRTWSAPLGRSAYGAFLLQGFVLIALALVLRPVPLPAEAKALLVAIGGIAGSFAWAWLLVSRVPWLARIL
ncbi:acyltransferase family protein [Agromyces sp. ZXT2-6]|uniref:acyltransferase family protein n=1 Tax=Agromyces sp. ZXT2-6 TaxID=3461153 RepID=UPI004054D1AA